MESIMRYILRNSIILLLSITGIVYVYRVLIQRKGPLVRVIVFHDVTDVMWFRKILTVLTKRYHVLTPDAFIKQEFNASKVNVLVTFDDGYTSWTEVCLPLLQEYDIRALFFINSGLLDVYENETERAMYVRERLQLKTMRRTLSWNGAQSLLLQGHTIGGHTKTHTRLSALGEDAQKAEIIEDRKGIEEMLEVQPVFFAFPFGNVGDVGVRSEALARSAGYRYIFSTEAGFVGDTVTGVVPRMCIEDALRESFLAQWMNGGYDVYARLKQLCVE